MCPSPSIQSWAQTTELGLQTHNLAGTAPLFLLRTETDPFAETSRSILNIKRGEENRVK